MTSPASLQQAFIACNAVLQQYRQYWQLVPFACQQLPWHNPALAEKLLALPEQELAGIDQSSALQQQHFGELFNGLFQLENYLNAADNVLPATELKPVPFWLTNGIAGRKLQQIDAFARQLPASKLPMLEWCAGKGHLGRLLAWQFNRPVTSIEWQQQLCADGSALASQFQIPQRFVHADVLTVQGSSVLAPQQQVLALHACGQLHIQLLQHAVATGSQQLNIVPCCYHLIVDAQYQPLSALAQQQDLRLSQHDLKLAVQGQVTAGARIEKLRHTEVQWRLAYQALRADLTGETDYRPLSSVAKHWFSGDFAEFGRWAAEQHQLPLPAVPDWQHYLQQGAAHAALVRRIELVRHLYRRPLELWLVLDRALFLEQHGYQVRLAAFCDYQVTPRNLLLQAERH
ncbi:MULTISPECIES: methyltransferase [unclassified Arsukibacterium]|uniref:methyltransferase n=2 Tax=Arsukibacterium TaxID=336830 RepID=UPI000C4495D6|nr:MULTISPECIES: methyltransferase [unclassified Arsukibacterium]MAA94529.1 methyltransferase [Rheinheimera sp.]MBM32889.1 methyltransferase [Rheinheimera sp.]HAW91580.1 methyltransferase [Candidatus Azambacteria bacterium]